MNKQQFINIWAPEGKKEEMKRDLDMVVKGEMEERACFMPYKNFE